MTTTDRTALRLGQPGGGGYCPVDPGAAEPHVVRTDLASGADGEHEPLLAIAHLSDLHVCDHQSPARVEFLDRYADPDSPILEQLGEVGAYRPQELLNAQVVEACVRAVNAVERAPITGLPIELAIATGDNTDNAQANELDWYLALLEGGPVHPDSGDLTQYEGIADGVVVDERYWHPEGAAEDYPRSIYGLPTVPGLLDAVRQPFTATGLTTPWLAVHGNHDRLMQGTVPGRGPLAQVAIGSLKPVGLPGHWSTDQVLQLMAGLEECDPKALMALINADMRAVTPDAARRILTRAEFIAAHARERARPERHGLTIADRAYYRHDYLGHSGQSTITLLVLDTVNVHGGWEGSLDPAQFAWLQAELTTADEEQRYVVLASHHPLETLVNAAGGNRILGAALQAMLVTHPCVVLWLAGHTHAAAVSPGETYWQVVAPSLVDWPQQARIVELSRAGGVLRISATMLDHAGEAPWSGDIDSIEGLAGLSRELAGNDWQWRRYAEHPRAGRSDERNVQLFLPDPYGVHAGRAAAQSRPAAFKSR
jgi:metallophosphoesterase (TIGR03767 family)